MIFLFSFIFNLYNNFVEQKKYDEAEKIIISELTNDRKNELLIKNLNAWKYLGLFFLNKTKYFATENAIEKVVSYKLSDITILKNLEYQFLSKINILLLKNLSQKCIILFPIIKIHRNI